MRGEHAVYADEVLDVQGSSPHARGARCRADEAAERPGIIPACAGSTGLKMSPITTARDHPRMRGEHDNADGKNYVLLRSSPHARGAQLV